MDGSDTGMRDLRVLESDMVSKLYKAALGGVGEDSVRQQESDRTTKGVNKKLRAGVLVQNLIKAYTPKRRRRIPARILFFCSLLPMVGVIMGMPVRHLPTRCHLVAA